MICNTNQASGFYTIRIFTFSDLFKEALEGAEHQTKLLLTPKIWKELFRNKLLDISHSAIIC